MATAMLAMLPPALVVLLMQKWFVKGLVDTEKMKTGHGRDLASQRRQALRLGPKANAGHPRRQRRDRRRRVRRHRRARRAAASRRCCAWSPGLEEITGGEISIGGRVVNDLEPKERDIAMVFQNYALYPHMTVFENMAYGLKIAKRAATPRSRRASTRPRRSWSSAPFLRAQAARALRRPAPARRDGPRDRAPAGGLPVRRAALEPRREAARADARSRSRSCTASCARPRSSSPTTRSRR